MFGTERLDPQQPSNGRHLQNSASNHLTLCPRTVPAIRSVSPDLGHETLSLIPLQQLHQLAATQDAETHGRSLLRPCAFSRLLQLTLLLSQLSKEDEEATGDETEVRREDQDKINKFSRLHQRELKYEEELKLKNVRSTSILPYLPVFH